MIPFKLFDSIAQNAHVLFGAVMILLPAALGVPGRQLWIPASVLFIAAAIKEFWYDQYYETKEVRGSNLKDFLFYCLGTALAALLFWLRWNVFN